MLVSVSWSGLQLGVWNEYKNDKRKTVRLRYVTLSAQAQLPTHRLGIRGGPPDSPCGALQSSRNWSYLPLRSRCCVNMRRSRRVLTARLP